MIEAADGIGTASHTGEHRVGQPPLLFQELRPDLPGDHRLKVPDDGGKGVGPHHGAQAVVGVFDAGGPLPHRLGYGVLQRSRACLNRNHLRSQKAHPVHIEGLADGILFPHKDHALHPHEGGGGGGGHSVLPRPRLGDQAGLAHPLGQKGLSQHIVDLVGPGVVQILPLQIDLRPAQILRHLLGEIQPGWPPRVFIQKLGELPVERLVILVVIVCLFQLNDRVHQRLRDILSPVDTEASLWIGHAFAPFLTAATKAAIFSGSLPPSVSIPELTSTPYGCNSSTAFSTLCNPSPPARK